MNIVNHMFTIQDCIDIGIQIDLINEDLEAGYILPSEASIILNDLENDLEYIKFCIGYKSNANTDTIAIC